MPPFKTERNDAIMAMRKRGLSLNDIVFELTERGFERISGERVRQIIQEHILRAQEDSPDG